MSPLDRHQQAFLQFSGGKDSLACLHLLREDWSRITVVWVNTGDAFPETRRQMQEIARLVPHFLEITTDQQRQIAEKGWPVDVLPIRATVLGKSYEPNDLPLMQPYVMCCAENVWFPLHAAMKAHGATLLIRGTRRQDAKKSQIASGAVHEGIEHWFPIEEWTGDQVRDWLTERHIALPDNYTVMDTSLDCQHCTAYLYENAGKFAYMKARHPSLHTEIMNRTVAIERAVREELAFVERITHERS